ncbi:MAG: hypothetical protein H6863_05360 [Rhodospirillales bacterium]|nr:hypothetical protein [Rhodospirillales bacterium]MCB9980544.1 hypothetical protein [Rhodospirillales bacterium]
MMMKNSALFPVLSVLGLVLMFFAVAGEVRAQDAAATAAPAITPDAGNGTAQVGAAVVPVPVEPRPILSLKGDVPAREIPSLFFTPETLALLKDALGGLNTTALADVGDGSPKEPGIRELALGGIVYESKEDWTIWLNGRRITPNTIPGEIFDMTVYKEFVDLKWYDAYTNRLFPIRLRANERFNLDSRLFLTGAHTADQQL